MCIRDSHCPAGTGKTENAAFEKPAGVSGKRFPDVYKRQDLVMETLQEVKASSANTIHNTSVQVYGVSAFVIMFRATPHKLQSFRLAEVYQHILWITSAVLPAKAH